jgi:hypothetical protein
VTDALDTFGANQQVSAVNQILMLLASAFPIIFKIPTKRTNLLKKLSVIMGEISNDLLIRSRREKDINMSETDKEKSVIGLLSAFFKKTFIVISGLTRQ